MICKSVPIAVRMPRCGAACKGWPERQRKALWPSILYRGEIVHKGQSHPGEHTPIIEQPLWAAVEAQLAGNTAERNSGTNTRQPSLLAGLLFDGDGNRITPTHAVKQGTRYHYYISRPLITNDQPEGSARLRQLFRWNCGFSPRRSSRGQVAGRAVGGVGPHLQLILGLVVRQRVQALQYRHFEHQHRVIR